MFARRAFHPARLEGAGKRGPSRSRLRPGPIHADRSGCQTVKGRDALVDDAARDDESKCARSVVTLSAKPWLVTQRAIRTPIAASFSVADPGAGQPGSRAGVDAERRRRANHHFLEIANVSVDIAAVGPEIENRIADELPRTVIGDVAATTGFEQPRRRRAASVGGDAMMFERSLRVLHAERDDRRMLEQQELIGNASGLALLRRAASAAPARPRTGRARAGGLRARARIAARLHPCLPRSSRAAP